MTIEEHIDYWVKTADHDWETVKTLYYNGHYDWCLFIGHLVLEKILKAHYVKVNNAVPPKIHDLVRLAEKTNIEFSEEIMTFFERAVDFMIEARYPDEKLRFYQICDKEFTTINKNKIQEIYEWLKSILKY